jgi:hypothetical protein
MMDEMMEALSILSGRKIIEGEWYELTEDDRGEGDEAPLGEGLPRFKIAEKVGRSWLTVAKVLGPENL